MKTSWYGRKLGRDDQRRLGLVHWKALSGRSSDSDVSINAVGCDRILGQQLNINILEFYLNGKIAFNNQHGKVLFLAMMEL